MNTKDHAPAKKNVNSNLVIGIGGSAGSLQSILQILNDLPEDLDAIILIAMHLSYVNKSYLRDILGQHTRLEVSEAWHGETLHCSTVYVGQAKEHLAVDGDRISLLPDPHRLRNLQAIDELFQSIAQSAGKHSIGIILSGLLHDGAEGLKAIKEANGLAIVQSPEEAAFAGMPRRALEAADVDFVATVEQIIVLVRRMAAFYDC